MMKLLLHNTDIMSNSCLMKKVKIKTLIQLLLTNVHIYKIYFTNRYLTACTHFCCHGCTYVINIHIHNKTTKPLANTNQINYTIKIYMQF